MKGKPASCAHYFSNYQCNSVEHNLLAALRCVAPCSCVAPSTYVFKEGADVCGDEQHSSPRFHVRRHHLHRAHTVRGSSAAAAAPTGERRVRASQRQLRELRRAYCASGSKYTGSPRERPSRFGRNLRADGGLSSQVLARRSGAHTHRRAEEERRVARARRLQAWTSASSRLIGLAPS